MREIKKYKGSKQAFKQPINRNYRVREHMKFREKVIKLQKNIILMILNGHF